MLSAKADRESNYVLLTFQNRKNYRDRNQINGCQKLGLGEGIGYKGIFRKFGVDKNILYINCAGGYWTIKICQNSCISI